MLNKCVLFTLISVLISTTLFAQSDEETDRAKHDKKSIKSNIRKARRNLSNREWDRAIFHYQIANDLDSTNPYHSYELGLAYYNSKLHNLDCIQPFKRALRMQNVDTMGIAYYYLAKTYHLMGDYVNALKNYETFRKLLVQRFFRYVALIEVMGDWGVKESINIYIKKLDIEIAKCKYGMELGEPKDKNWRAVNLGDKVNSAYPDYAAVFSPDETKLIYTSRREGTKGGRIYGDNIPFEDIYVSDIIDSVTWSNPVQIEKSDLFKGITINTRKNESMIGFSSGGERAYIMRKNDIMYTELKDTRWTKPKKLKEGQINTRAFEPSMFLYPEGAIFYFSSDRKG
ncbi:MAG: PD40 domain-containing protein, partial [Bacteroidetes bacterium]|nr:PD40 domain-containing protein [Bacteroidota bacterium]